MALDTRNKRAATLGLMPEPDGVINSGDRRQLLGWFRITGAVTPGAYGGDSRWTAKKRQTTWTAKDREGTYTAPHRDTTWGTPQS